MTMEEQRNHKIYVQWKAGYTQVYLASKYFLPVHQVRRIIRKERQKQEAARA